MMAKQFVIQITALTDNPEVGRHEISAAIHKTLNAQGVILERLMIEEIKEAAA